MIGLLDMWKGICLCLCCTLDIDTLLNIMDVILLSYLHRRLLRASCLHALPQKWSVALCGFAKHITHGDAKPESTAFLYPHTCISKPQHSLCACNSLSMALRTVFACDASVLVHMHGALALW